MYPLINGEVINGDGELPFALLRPTKFGLPKLSMEPKSIHPVAFGVAQVKHGTDVVAAPLSILATRFGALGIVGGMPPSAKVFPAGSLHNIQFGKQKAGEPATV